MYSAARCLLEDAVAVCDNYERQAKYAQAAEQYRARGVELETYLLSQQKPKQAPQRHGGAAPPPYGTSPQRAQAEPARQQQPPAPASHAAPAASAPAPVTVPQAQHVRNRRRAGGAGAASKPLNPNFLSLKPGRTPVVRAELRIEAGGEHFDGVVQVPTKALQHFLSKKADATPGSPAVGGDSGDGGDLAAAGRAGDPGNGGANGSSKPRDQQGDDKGGPPSKDDGGSKPVAGDDGAIVGASPKFGQEAPRGLDSGVAFRDKNWNDLVRQSQAEVGPPQVPLDEKVSLAERAQQQKRQAQAPNARINAKTSDGRLYSIDGGLEKKAFIDPNRTLDQTIRTGGGKAPTVAPPDLKNVVASPEVLFETTAMGAKLRNQHRIGGERVKEMDHFVATVETPEVRVTQKDVSPLVAEMEMKGADPVKIMSLSDTEHYAGEVGDIELKIQSRYRNADGSVNEPILRHAAQFYPFIQAVCQIVGYTGQMQLYYMTTMRANSAVCSVSKEDGRLYCNVLSFQQSQPLDPESGKVVHTKRLWTYWVQRMAISLSAGSPEWASRPTGLYDPEIRARFNKQLDALGLSKKG